MPDKKPPGKYDGRARAMHGRMMATRRRLVELFPKCFIGFTQPKLPLKVGISRDIVARLGKESTQLFIGAALADYTSGASYLAALVAGATRVDLDGNPAGVVSEQAAALAAKHLKKRLNADETKKAAKAKAEKAKP